MIQRILEKIDQQLAAGLYPGLVCLFIVMDTGRVSIWAWQTQPINQQREPVWFMI